MNMQDEDIDRLFSTKLQNMEVAPAGKVWNGIRVELKGAKQKSAFIPVIGMAATVMLVLGIGLFLLLNNLKTTMYQANNARIIIHSKPAGRLYDTLVQITAIGKPVPVKKSTVHVKVYLHKNYAGLSVNKLVTGTVKHNRRQPLATAKKLDAAAPAGPVLAATNTGLIADSSPVIVAAPLNLEKKILPSETFTPAKALTAQLPQVKQPAKRHGIRSIGDILNVVIARVDKRADKVIEFSNTDEDESTITGINLGVLRIKKNK